MGDQTITAKTSQTLVLQRLLAALDEAELRPDTAVSILIRVQDKPDHALKITLDNANEMQEILRLTLGIGK